MKHVLLATGLALALNAPLPGTAQEAQPFGDWVLVCDGGQPCRMVQQQTVIETGALAVRLIAVKTSDGAILAAQVPMGVHLPSGAVYRLRTPEDAPQREMIWQRCMSDVCEAALPLDADELALFSQNDALLFAYRMSPNEEARIIQVSLNGFEDGLAKTGVPAE